MKRTYRLLPCLALLCAMVAPAFAHESTPVGTRLTLGPEAAYHLELEVDLYALATGRPPGHGSEAARQEWAAFSADQRVAAIENLKNLLRRRLRVRLDGEVATPEVLLPDAVGDELGRRVVFRGVAPETVETIQISPSRALPALILTVRRKSGEAAGATADRAEETVTVPRGESGPVWSWRAPAVR